MNLVYSLAPPLTTATDVVYIDMFRHVQNVQCFLSKQHLVTGWCSAVLALRIICGLPTYLLIYVYGGYVLPSFVLLMYIDDTILRL